MFSIKIERLKTTVFIPVFLLSTRLFAQQPAYVSTADSLRQTGNLPAALRAYASLFAKNPHDERNYYGYACALAVNAEYSEAYRYLNLANEAAPSLQPLTDPSLLNLRMNGAWDTYQAAVIKKVTAKYGNIPQLDIARQLWEMKALDGLYNREMALLNNSMGKDAMIIHLLLRAKDDINLNNQKKLIKIADANGWPGISQVGKEAAAAAAIVLQHSVPAVQKKYLPLLKEACSKQEADWKYYAVICDQVLISEHKKQLYGTQVALHFSSGRYLLLPVEDEVNVDKRRAEIGLQPLANYLQQWNISYTTPVK